MVQDLSKRGDTLCIAQAKVCFQLSFSILITFLSYAVQTNLNQIKPFSFCSANGLIIYFFHMTNIQMGRKISYLSTLAHIFKIHCMRESKNNSNHQSNSLIPHHQNMKRKKLVIFLRWIMLVLSQFSFNILKILI